MISVYFISGIGGDRRLFSHIRLPEGFQARYVDWIPPEPKEPLSSYALRLTAQIDAQRPFILAGISLGGIIAVEIAKRFPPVATILIGSVPTSAQFPWYYTLARSLKITALFPASFFKRAAIFKRLFTREKAADKELIRQMIRDGSPGFIKWALDAVLDWRNEAVPQPLWHIHGSRDEVFPVSLTRPSHTIPKAGHMPLMSHSAEINNILGDILRHYSPPLSTSAIR
jgi:pimeloyl-ACP methyl ester carboxylesterase